MNISTYIFDLDGTLTDPLQGMANSINHALQQHGFGQRELNEIAQYVGPPLEDTLVQLTGRDDQTTITSLVASYRECYLQTGYAENAVYDGIRGMLDKLRGERQRMGVCTSKPAATARKILALFELDAYFEFVSGGDIGIKKYQQLEVLLGAGDIDGHALMIGDRAVDITAAQSNRLRSAAVFWGYGSKLELTEAGADFGFARPEEVTQLVGVSA